MSCLSVWEKSTCVAALGLFISGCGSVDGLSSDQVAPRGGNDTVGQLEQRLGSSTVDAAWVNGNEASFEHSNAHGVTTVTKTNTGRYTIEFYGMADPGGNVQVAAVGDNNRRCKVNSWAPSADGAREVINIRCATAGGSAANSKFYVYFAREPLTFGSGYSIAYLYANQSGANNYTPDLNYNFNSDGGPSTIQRLSTGRYRVSTPGVNSGLGGGIVNITAKGGSANYCKIVDWWPEGSTLKTEVTCWEGTGTGNPVDSQFTFLFMVGSSLQTFDGAYAWNPGVGGDTPAWWTYDSYRNGPACQIPSPYPPFSISGDLTVFPDQLRRAGEEVALVTAVGEGSNYCKIREFAQTYSTFAGLGRGVIVSCFDRDGDFADESYNVLLDYPGDTCGEL